MPTAVHNPDQYMLEFRKILAQGRKRIGFLVGAGAPASVHFDTESGSLDPDGPPLIPTMGPLSERVLKTLNPDQQKVVDQLKAAIKQEGLDETNLEILLSRIRTLGEILGDNEMYNCSGTKFKQLASRICEEIGSIVAVDLPTAPTPYSELVGWIGGALRDHPVEVFTPNYDTLLETAFERAGIPYFDGFCGSVKPFFDATSLANDDLPARWARLWKIHGSLGWDTDENGTIYRGAGKKATSCIFPTHEKYQQMQKMPYTAMFDRLRRFIEMPDSVLLICGFSFSDRHITAVINEALVAHPGASVMTFQYRDLDSEETVCRMATSRANLSVYCTDGAVVSCIGAKWQLGHSSTAAWEYIRPIFWGTAKEGDSGVFKLGDFVHFSRYIASTKATHAPLVQESSNTEMK